MYEFKRFKLLPLAVAFLQLHHAFAFFNYVVMEIGAKSAFLHIVDLNSVRLTSGFQEASK